MLHSHLKSLNLASFLYFSQIVSWDYLFIHPFIPCPTCPFFSTELSPVVPVTRTAPGNSFPWSEVRFAEQLPSGFFFSREETVPDTGEFLSCSAESYAGLWLPGRGAFQPGVVLSSGHGGASQGHGFLPRTHLSVSARAPCLAPLQLAVC